MAAEDVLFYVHNQPIAARRWHSGAAHRVLALHGWLDNCASFDFLAPLLPALDIVALDLPGHGKSYHRAHLGGYNIWQDIAEIVQIVSQLGWSEFSLLGHSRGAMINSLIAASFPAKVTHVVAIDALLPEPLSAAMAPAQLALAAERVVESSQRPRHYYPSFEAAVASRMHGLTKLTLADARALAQRGVGSDNSGYYWGGDYKLTSPSEIKYTPDQLDAFAAQITAPVLLIIGQDGITHRMDNFDRFRKKIAQLRTVPLVGGHHLHMSTQCVNVASHIHSFILDR